MQALGAAAGGGADATPPPPPPQALAWTPMRTYSSLNTNSRGPAPGGSVGAKRVRVSEPDADVLGAGARLWCVCNGLQEVCMRTSGMCCRHRALPGPSRRGPLLEDTHAAALHVRSGLEHLMPALPAGHWAPLQGL
jgi:hypothetical protein